MLKIETMQRLGEERLNYQKCLMKIIEYKNCDNIVIEFQDEYKAKVNTRYDKFISGSIKNPYYPTVLGVGIVDKKYPTSKNGKNIKEHATWINMLKRCYDKKTKEKYPTYKDVYCCEEWLYYSNFYEWLHSQSNFDKWLNNKKWDLDKDILHKNNKLYSPENCCLVPQNVNTLFTNSSSTRGDYPIGVQRHGNKYRASFTMCGKHVSYTSKNTIEDAFMDYKKSKENYIKQVAQEEYDKGNITKQCYDAMMNYIVEITD